MKTKFKKLSDARVEITVTLDKSDWQPAEEKALERLAKDVKVEGFRKGKTPVEVAKKFIPENDLNAQTVDIAVRSTVMRAFQENEQRPLALPMVNVTKMVPGEMIEYTAEAEIVPEIKLGNYKKLKTKPDKVEVGEEEIEHVLSNVQEAFAEKKTVRRAAKLGDEAIIDFTGKKGGEPFAGGSAKDQHLTLGSKMFIPGFEDGVVGHEPGDKFELKLTFPKDYRAKDLAGEEVVFEVLLKQVNEITKPEVDDELAKKCGPFQTVAELKADVKRELTEQKTHQAEEKLKNQLLDELVKVSKIPAPELLVDDQVKFIRNDVTRNAAAHGMNFAQVLEQTGQTAEEWDQEARKVAEQRVRASLALQKIAADEKIGVSDEELDERIAAIREAHRKEPAVQKNLKQPEVRMDIRNRMAIEKVLDYLVKTNE